MVYPFNKRRSTGIFIPSGRGFAELKDIDNNSSINQITIALGYHTDQVYSPRMGGRNAQIHYIGMEIFTRNIAFVVTTKETTFITQKQIDKLLNGFSVTKEFDGMRVSEILTDGIENSSMPVQFMARVLALKDISNNGMFYAERIKTYLYFTDGVLNDFHFDDGLFPWARHLKAVNSTIFNWITDLAYKYWPDNDFQAKMEINMQCEAWGNIPGAFGNEFIELHRTENGGANMHMLRVCHYNYPINIKQFEEINHGRFELFDEDDERTTYKSGKFVYRFNRKSGILEHILSCG